MKSSTEKRDWQLQWPGTTKHKGISDWLILGLNFINIGLVGIKQEINLNTQLHHGVHICKPTVSIDINHTDQQPGH